MGNTQKLGNYVNAIFQDASNNIGIGAAPSGSYKLEVTGTAKVSSTLLVSGALTGSAVATFTAAANPLILKSTSATTGYTEYYYNTSTLAGVIGNGGGILSGANNSDFIIRSEADFVVAAGGNNRRMTISSGGKIGTSSSVAADVLFNIVNSSSTGSGLNISAGSGSGTYALRVENYNGASSLLYVRGDGNVGIGTTTPTSKVTITDTGVYGSALNLSEGGFGAWVQGSTEGLTHAFIGNFKYNFTTPSSSFSYYSGTGYGIDMCDGIRFFSAQSNVTNGTFTPTERMRITSGGVTLFGGTTFTTITSAVLGATNPAFTGRNWSFGPNSSGDYVVYHNQGGGNTGVYLSYGGSSWTSNSDEKIKDIIEVIPNALESIKDFRAVKFYWKGDESKKENLGLIAQDVQKSYPQLIDKQINDNDEVLGVRYTELIPVLVKAIQEQQAIITSLQDRLTKGGL